MTQCDFHAERNEDARAEARVVIERPDRDRIQYLCGTCIEIYSDAVQAVLGPVDPRDVPKEHRTRTLNRWLEKIEFPDDDQLVEECWEWRASTVQGYGSFRFDGGTGYAHRYAWEYSYGVPAPAKEDAVELLHECGNKLCVNPAHLWAGTRSQNMNHAVETGQINRAISNADTEREIRNRYETEDDTTLKSLAGEYDVGKSTIHRIVSGD